MRNKTKILLFLTIVFTIISISSCSYAELPPKTDDVSYSFVLPKGERPSSEELKTLYEIRNEYNNSTKK